MAKKTRMGRNLNALLGGATRNRAAETAEADNPSGSASVAKTQDSRSGDDRPGAVERDESGATPARSDSDDGASAPSEQSPAHIESAAQSQHTAASTPVAPVKSHDITGSTGTTGSQPTQDQISVNASDEDAHPSDRLRMLGVDQITRGMYQPRRHFDQTLLQELADSIKAQGLIQPILVRAYAGKYELIAGERRWRAAQLAGITDIPAIVRDMDDQSVAAVSLIENIQRADLNPLEEAQALERLCGEFSMTHSQVAEAVGRSRVAVTNLMRLLELHDDVKLKVDQGELDMGHARALLGAPRSDQPALAARVVKENLTVRAIEKLVKDLRLGKTPPSAATAKTDPNIEALGKKLSNVLGAPVNIRHQKSGSGKLEISYSSVDELEGILSHIKK